ncbi:ribosomal protein S18-alanine N-acetyltransferase [Bifidobacterium sp. ESL0690]|uniref:ribosomal protein S18-alanine N-acetyltransferase n=1 Tax=Bifidobacterium sp. ESL0690 TaxID=2983214 RepID=UPI0023F81483|nr:ribosomal protein S18-alanine N-acetyltransferase [Bifidobacterium sp. ESL0690]WEV45924.1 ribosomal protein S18-alanine N-acetyltransferase [Bifidobacterium sp. ESL0690]
MIVKFGELNQQRALEAAAKLETELFASQAWDMQTLRDEVTDASRIYLADVIEVTDASDNSESSDAADVANLVDATKSNKRPAREQTKQLQRVDVSKIMRGYAGMWHADGQAEITTIGVAKRFQRNGIAKNLLDSLIRYARHHGVRRIKLEVRVDNEPAKRLYCSLGFKKIGLLRHYYQPEDVDAVEMALDLEPHIMGFSSEKQNMEQHQ